MKKHEIIYYDKFPTDERGLSSRHCFSCKKDFMIEITKDNFGKKGFCPYCGEDYRFFSFCREHQIRWFYHFKDHEQYRLYESGELQIGWLQFTPTKPSEALTNYEEKSVGIEQECVWCNTRFASLVPARYCYSCGEPPKSINPKLDRDY